jgi:hypothetical protein
MADYTKKPRMTSSKKECMCAETLVVINKGQNVLYVPETKKAYCKSSERYAEFVIDLNKKND